jgi:hypothetical protein
VRLTDDETVKGFATGLLAVRVDQHLTLPRAANPRKATEDAVASKLLGGSAVALGGVTELPVCRSSG